MADIALVTANRVRVVESIIQSTHPAAEAIVAGAPVRYDTATGRLTNSNGTSAAEARTYGVAVKTVVAGEALTALRKGVMDGFVLDAMAYDAPVYVSDTDGRLGTTVGTVTLAVGRVIPAHATLTGTASDKLLFVDL